MKGVYVAAPWKHKEAAQVAAATIARQLNPTSSTVWACSIVSRWLWVHEDTTDPIMLRREALNDVEDLRACAVFVLLNLDKSDGKATELGMAYAWGKRIIVVGPDTGNVFYHLPEVTVVKTLEDAISLLKTLQS